MQQSINLLAATSTEENTPQQHEAAKLWDTQMDGRSAPNASSITLSADIGN